jgi:hypothetical protein
MHRALTARFRSPKIRLIMMLDVHDRRDHVAIVMIAAAILDR